MPNYHITVHGADREAMADLVRAYRVRVYGQTLTEEDTGYRVSALADEETITRLRAEGYRIEQHEDVDEAARDSLRDVGQGNRFLHQGRDGVADKDPAAEPATPSMSQRPAMTYLNVEEVETAIALAAGAPNAGFTELIALPNQTWEGRACHAIRVHQGAPARSGVYLLGGIHAREWGSPDILVNFVQLLTDAYRDGTGITQGGASVSAVQVRAIVETLDVVVFPQANPDGRHYSMTIDPMWRKNRRPAGVGDPGCPSGGGNGPGVDLNRNYDFLWDFPTTFSPSAPVATSADPCSEVYYGPGAVSEPETNNVVWLLDRYPSVGYFIDIHSFGEDILFNWGDDDDQVTDPAMTFSDPAYDGKRGIPDSAPGGDPDKYREYIPPEDRHALIRLGTIMRDAIQAARGRAYTLKQAVGLYPTSGTSDDYAYSRSFLDSSKKTVLGYTIEWGPQRSSIPKSFHPDYPDMVPIIEEITAGLLAFCLAATRRTLDAALAGAGT